MSLSSLATLIQTDTVWMDPVTITTSSVVVFPNVTLTIQGTQASPLTVTFGDSAAAINLQGFANLVVSHTVFEGVNGGLGVQYLSNEPATVVFDGVSCVNMTECVHVQGRGSSLRVSNSLFENTVSAVILSPSPMYQTVDFSFMDSHFVNNQYGLRLQESRMAVNMTGCHFTNNSDGFYISSTSVIYIMIDGSTFIDNERGINLKWVGDRITARNSLFLRNTEYAVGGNEYGLALKTFIDCVFAFNNRALDNFNNRLHIAKSLFMENQLVNGGRSDEIIDSVFYRNGIALFDALHVNSTTFEQNGIALQGSAKLLTKCNFVNNTEYHIRATSSTSTNAINLYWGTTDQKEIRTKIFDIFQDASLGLVTIEPVAPAPFGVAFDWRPHTTSFLGISITPPVVSEVAKNPTMSPGISGEEPTNTVNLPFEPTTSEATQPASDTIAQTPYAPTVTLGSSCADYVPDFCTPIEDMVSKLTTANLVLEQANKNLEEANQRLQEANDLLLMNRRALANSGAHPLSAWIIAFVVAVHFFR